MCLGRLAKGLYYFVGLANVVNQPITDKTYYIIFSNICQELFYFIFILYFIRWALHPHTMPCSGCRVSYLAQQKIGCSVKVHISSQRLCRLTTAACHHTVLPFRMSYAYTLLSTIDGRRSYVA